MVLPTSIFHRVGLLGGICWTKVKVRMGCRFTIYSLFMDIHNSFLDIQNSFLDIHNSFLDIHNSFLDIHNSFLDIIKSIYGYP